MSEQGVQRKVKPLNELAKQVRAFKQAGKTVVQCHGVFDLVHPGHLRHFQSAKREGDVLVVTVTADKYVKRGPGRPLFNEQLRAEALAALEIIDLVGVVRKPTVVECLHLLQPNVYAKGPDYRNAKQDVTGKITDEKQAVEEHGGRLHVTDDITFSSTRLINQALDSQPPETQRYLDTLKKRHSAGDITEAVKGLAGLRVLVIGDAIIDQYDYCRPMGKSGKEPLVVSNFIRRESFAGGALATANHAASLSRRVQLLSLLGRKDSWREFAGRHLATQVKPRFFYRTGAVTTVKRRYLLDGAGRKMFEVYFMNDEPIAGPLEAQMVRWLRRSLKNFDVVVINDFGHGLITNKLIAAIVRGAKKLALNVQTNGANAGFNLVTKYPRADFVCVDEVELRYAAHDRVSPLEKVMQRVQAQLHCELMVTTRGADGSLSLSRRRGFLATPAFATRVVDAVGAGDAYFAFASLVYAGDLAAELVPFIGNVAGSLATQIVGNRDVVQLPDVLKYVTRLLK
jgi:rfaE bifunctional protein nucleotidyltransferase chain/domain